MRLRLPYEHREGRFLAGLTRMRQRPGVALSTLRTAVYSQTPDLGTGPK